MDQHDKAYREMLRLNLIAGCILVAFSLVVIFWLIPFQIEVKETDQSGMSSRFFPYLSAITLLLLAALLAVINGWKMWSNQEGVGEESEENERLGFGRKEVVNLVFMIMGVVVFMALMVHIGFLISSTLLLLVSMYLAGVRSYPLFLVSIVFPLAIKQLFWFFFDVYLP